MHHQEPRGTHRPAPSEARAATTTSSPHPCSIPMVPLFGMTFLLSYYILYFIFYILSFISYLLYFIFYLLAFIFYLLSFILHFCRYTDMFGQKAQTTPDLADGIVVKQRILLFHLPFSPLLPSPSPSLTLRQHKT